MAELSLALTTHKIKAATPLVKLSSSTYLQGQQRSHCKTRHQRLLHQVSWIRAAKLATAASESRLAVNMGRALGTRPPELCGWERSYLKLQEGDVEEFVQVFEAKAVLHGRLGIAKIWRPRRSAQHRIKRRRTLRMTEGRRVEQEESSTHWVISSRLQLGWQLNLPGGLLCLPRGKLTYQSCWKAGMQLLSRLPGSS